MRRITRIALAIPLTLAIALATAWAALALWYRLPVSETARPVASALVAVAGLMTIGCLFSRWRYRAVAVFIALFCIMLFWWSTIVPPANADFAPDVARQVTGTVEGNVLTLSDVRDFRWSSDTRATPSWTTRTYDLNEVRTVDVFMSYWSGPKIAHMILSFGFSGGEQLAWSIEVRHSVGGAFSPLADLFKSNPLVIIAADERDVVGVRSNFRGEDVQLYRIKASQEQARMLLLEYVHDANELSKTPQFYNSVTTNCTTTVAKMMRAVGDKVPFDWRLIVNGYLPDYAYDRAALDTKVPMSQLRLLSHIDGRARADGLSPTFSQAIRAGVPSPN